MPRRGWHTVECDGLDAGKVSRALDEAIADERPSSGPLQDGHRLWRAEQARHGGDPWRRAGQGRGRGGAQGARARTGGIHGPDDVLAAWREVGQARRAAAREWQRRLDASKRKDQFLARMAGKSTTSWLKPHLDRLIAEPQTVATRKASEMALEAINAAIPATIGGSADLTGSNNTKTKGQEPLTADYYGGRYIYYGIREFGMAAAMNGMALHGGVIPYGGTFLIFSDYCRPAIRLSARCRSPRSST